MRRTAAMQSRTNSIANVSIRRKILNKVGFIDLTGTGITIIPDSSENIQTRKILKQ